MRGDLLLWTLSLLALLHLGAHARARACSCADLTPEQAAAQADAIFEGRVQRVERQGGERVAQLRVTRAWKGVTTEEVTVRTADSSAACGVSFEPDTYWLVYAEERAGGLRTGLCTRTRPADDAEADLAALGAGVTPVDPLGDAPIDEEGEAEDAAGEEAEPPRAAPPASRSGCASCSAGAPDAPWSLALLLLWAVRRRQR